MKFAMIGTRGVPAHYGGFETAIEEVGARLAERGHEVVVFCRPVEGEDQPDSYRGMDLVWLPSVSKRSLETLSHTALSVVNKNLKGIDSAIVFNAANAPFLPVLRARRIPFATHVDGLEWRRAKWGPTGQKYYRTAEALSVRWSDALIADAQGIADYYRDEFHADTELIAYGAPILSDLPSDKLEEFGVTAGEFHLVVARFEPENHVLEIVKGYVESEATKPLIVVGSAPYSNDYTDQIHAAADERVRLAGGVWDQELLDQLYGHALTYLHGHSVGGTNPSLLRAAGAGASVIAYDVNFNREVLGEGNGWFFKTPSDVAALVERAERDPQGAHAMGESIQRDITRYSWDGVASSYERLLIGLAKGEYRGKRPSGRRYPSEWSK